jgi:hypothetical protein
VAEHDARRRQDLATVAQALVAYGANHGAFPQALGVQSLCRYPADAGCSLKEELDVIPHDPIPDGTYYYQSDGKTFILFAVMETASDRTGCPSPLPSEMSQVPNIYCVQGALPSP